MCFVKIPFSKFHLLFLLLFRNLPEKRPDLTIRLIPEDCVLHIHRQTDCFLLRVQKFLDSKVHRQFPERLDLYLLYLILNKK